MDELVARRALVDAEHGAANASVLEEARRTSLARLCGVDMSIRLAAHGLRMVSDLHQWVMDYREMNLTKLVGLSAQKRCAVIRLLSDWWEPRFFAALAAQRAGPGVNPGPAVPETPRPHGEDPR